MAWTLTIKETAGKKQFWVEPIFTSTVLFASEARNYDAFAVVGNHRVLFNKSNKLISRMFSASENVSESLSLVDNGKDRFAGHAVHSFAIFDIATLSCQVQFFKDCGGQEMRGVSPAVLVSK